MTNLSSDVRISLLCSLSKLNSSFGRRLDIEAPMIPTRKEKMHISNYYNKVISIGRVIRMFLPSIDGTIAINNMKSS